jgi:hypothetical protein
MEIEGIFYFVVYAIHEIRKVGCTNNFERRKKQNRKWHGKDIEIEIVDLIPVSLGYFFAGNIEWYYADWFGYPRGNHYVQNWGRILTSDQLSKQASKAGTIRKNQMNPEERKRIGWGFENHSYNGSEKKKEDALKGARRASELKVTGMQSTVKCPYCPKVGQTRVMGRWHFDNCPEKR